MSMHHEAGSHRHPRLALLLGALLAAASVTGCRTDVDGVWEGTIGEDQARFSLDQAGSIVGGEACIASVCADIEDGEIVEGDLSLEFGCPSCGIGPTLIDAYVEGATISGVAYVEDCECAADGCECVLAVELDRAN